MIEVHLYGRLRRYGPSDDAKAQCVVRAEPGADHRSVGDFVAAIGVPCVEVASVFVDGRWARAGLNAPVAGVARLGLFPKEMTLLYV